MMVSFKISNYKSLGIIYKTEAEAKKTAELLRTNITDVHFLSSQSSAFVNGIIITSAHMAKGLEFDEVIVPFTEKKNYKTEIDRSMLYEAVTRAMHRLSLTYSGEITGLLKR